MTRYAIVDLEATDTSGLENSGRKIIQIGIVILENDKVLKTFSSEVNPHEPLTENIMRLTGLKDEQLKEAPDFADLIPDLKKILKGCVFVAHNVVFDWGLLAKSFAEYDVNIEMPRVDTVELAKIFFPTFEKYGLESLKTKLGLKNKHLHTALSDARETAELLVRIQSEIKKLPSLVIQKIQQHASALTYETKLIIDELAPLAEDRTDEFNFYNFIAIGKKELNRKESQKLSKISEDFSENLTILGLKKRKIQNKIADYMKANLTEMSPTFIEAPTGSGKTIAYLLPLVAVGRKVIVSTTTKVLQEQILQDLAPKLSEYFDLKTTKLMAASNYVSLEKVEKYLSEKNAGANTEIFKMKVLVWLTQTQTGELSELSKNVTKPEMFESISNSGNDKTEHDFWRSANKQALKSDILVLNHAYLLELLRKESELFAGRTLVADEAQGLLQVLESANQEHLEILDELLPLQLLNASDTRADLENLLFQLAKTPLNRERIFIEAAELGLDKISEFMIDPENIYWTTGNTLNSSQPDFYNFKKLLSKSQIENQKVIFISASIAFSDKQVLLPELLGFEQDYKFYKIHPKINKNQKIFAVADGLAVKNATVQDYSHYLFKKLSELAELNRPIIVLFSSRQMLDWTARQFEKSSIKVGVQQAGQLANNELLKKQFDDEKFQILLATGAFWEGVDFEKQKRAILVIPRLPFSTPEDVLTRKFSEKYKNPFYDFNLPMAAMKLRQAMGRVNRKISQRSAIVILDNRIVGNSYAKRLRKNLEELVKLENGNFDELLSQIKDFLK